MADPALFLKPADGRRVRHPDGRLLDEVGEAVTPSSYWDRKLADDDVTVARDQKAPPSRPDAGGSRSSSPAGDSGKKES